MPAPSCRTSTIRTWTDGRPSRSDERCARLSHSVMLLERYLTLRAPWRIVGQHFLIATPRG
jgi:hypothetical protein